LPSDDIALESKFMKPFMTPENDPRPLSPEDEPPYKPPDDGGAIGPGTGAYAMPSDGANGRAVPLPNDGGANGAGSGFANAGCKFVVIADIA
jgi:hypothetical protein